MVWQDWWPHDRLPQSMNNNPYLVHCEKDKGFVYVVGLGGCKPVMYIPSITGWKLLSGCKYAEHQPFATGTHLWVKCHNNTPLACAATFGLAFSFGIFSTWLMHG